MNKLEIWDTLEPETFPQLTEKWDLRYLRMAREIANFSKDPSTKCGAVLVQADRSPISFGFNGLPKNIPASAELEILNNRGTKIALILHAEENCVRFAESKNLEGSCIYIYPFMPCSKCSSLLMQYGIKRVVAPKMDEKSERYLRWKESFELTAEFLELGGVELKLYDFE